MQVPLLDLGPQIEPLEDELKAAFERVLRSTHYIMGPELEAFEQEVADFIGVRHTLGVSSGTDALVLALMALGIGPGDEVLVPTFTFFATAGSVARVGATPVWVEACPVCFNLDVSDAATKITSATKAIIPVHLFGQAANMSLVKRLAEAHGLAVIEDAAQALGARHQGKQAGSMGTCGTFSFFPSKNLGGFGDAGLISTNDDAFYEAAKIRRVHGGKPKYYHAVLGGNFRMDPLQAALLRVKLPHYQSYTEARQRHAAYYQEQLGALDEVVVSSRRECCCSLEELRERQQQARLVLPCSYEENYHIWNQFTLRVPGPGRRDALRDHFKQRGIGCEVYYPVTMDQQECFRGIGKGAESITRAHALADEVLSIPVFPELTDAQRSTVVEAIKDFLSAE